jgi:MFS family permease
VRLGWLQLVKAGYSGVLPSLLSEQFPVETRAIGVSLSFSTAVSIFGGLAPLVATWLIASTGDSLSPSYYLIFTALLSLFALTAIQWRSRRVTEPTRTQAHWLRLEEPGRAARGVRPALNFLALGRNHGGRSESAHRRRRRRGSSI